ncbi:MAG: PQQ-binding-like beta-propeller repeat protein [Fuerstiella sp.]|nr:PQQ-binding-like beta-propeller repeat protein [Fuerstiella sp.]
MIQQARGTVYFLATLFLSCSVPAEDWPMWRANPERTGSSSETLPSELRLMWTRQFEQRVQAWDDPLNLDLMTYDRVFEPIVMDGRVFVGFNDRDKLTAFDSNSGDELWSFFTDGPVRLPAAGWDGKVYFSSDDGCLYCVEAATGTMVWKFQGAPGKQKVIGNHRVISAWPARGGPVIRDQTVYFAASIWPMMGTFLYALDAATGEVQWVNDSTGAQYIKQPHSAPSFAGVAPQGALVATNEFLVVPGGRSVPAVLQRSNGQLRYFEINAGGKGTGGSFVVADNQRFYVHTRLKGTRAFELNSGLKTDFMPHEPVLVDGIVYSAESAEDSPVIRAYDQNDQIIWEIEADGRGDLIRAGNHLYAAGKESITVIRLPGGEEPATIAGSIPVQGQVERLLAGDEKLFAVTIQGSLLAFGADSQKAIEPQTQKLAVIDTQPDAVDVISDLIQAVDAEGYAYWYGISNESLIHALAAHSPFTQLAIIDPDQQNIDRLRRLLDTAGLYGSTTAHCASPVSYRAPKYTANLVFVGRELTSSAPVGLFAELYESVRPYGGVMHLIADNNREQLAELVRGLQLEQAEVTVTHHSVMIRRTGRLPGSADWTHQYGDIANTVKSDDRRVKLPLGILWFGGSSNMDVLPRHGHGPPEQVAGGRLFIEGINSLSARDVYTGRVLWKREFENLGTFDVYYDETYTNTPLDPKYNQVHIPGANGRGTNYIVTDDLVYVVEDSRCHIMDPASGVTIQEIQLPQDESGGKRQWGYIGVYEDVLLGGFGYANYRDRNKLDLESDRGLRRNRAGFGSKSLDRAASLGLVAFDRHSGTILWQVSAKHSFWHNGIIAGGGRIYCLDRTPELIEAALRRRGSSRADSYRIAAFDAETGNTVWEITDGVFGTWLGYSEKHDLLLQAGAAASDRLYEEIGRGMAVFHADDGTLKWKNDTTEYAGPCMLHGDWIITNANSYTDSAGAFHITDGHQKMVANPLTGEQQPWKVTRTYGCNNIVASEHLLTFRSGAAGFYDLLGESGTGNFGGFKSGCTSNLVVANGVLNAPDYTRTCSCAYQNQTSLALVHMPELEFWTINPTATNHTEFDQLSRVGVNIGAPGDRRTDDGVLWLEYPPVAGPSPLLSVTLNDDAELFRHHSSSVGRNDKSWVLSSGADNVQKVSVRFTLTKEINLSSGLPVNHTDDDAEEKQNGDVHTGSGDLELVEDGETQLVGMRFNQINLASGADIRSAYIQFICDEPSAEPTSLMISAQDSGHAERFSNNRHDLTSRPKTSQEVGWQPDEWKKSGDAGDAQRTADITPLIRAVTGRPDWEPGNSIVFFIRGAGKRTAMASQGRGEESARLVIDANETQPDDADKPTPYPYQVRLLFGTPLSSPPTKRRFDVVLQGKTLHEDMMLDPAGPPEYRFAVETFENVMIADELQIELNSKEGTPVLSGIEIQRTE